MEQQEKELGTKEQQKPKNAEKKARQFDFASMFAETVQTARDRTEETKPHEEVEETGGRFTNLYIPSGGSSQDDNDEVGFALPSRLSSQLTEEEDEEFFPPLPPGFVPDSKVMANDEEIFKAKSTKKPIEDDDEYDDPINVSNFIPVACELIIKHSNKPVTALAFDLQGSKFALGGYNYSVQMFEFQKMDMLLKPFREIYPSESHIINSLAYSTNGENLVVASGNAQLKVLNRNGQEWCETVKGDQYLVDIANTKWHTAAVNCVVWHPLSKKEFLTCSDDGSLRIWSIDDYKEITKCINTQQKIIKVRNAGGKRAIPTTCCYSRDGKLIAAGCDDGSIHVWKNGNIFVNTAYLNRKAHNGAISSLEFSLNNERILSRSLDDTMKMFELKSFKEPVLTAKDLPCLVVQTTCGFSPHGEFVFTGTSSKSKTGGESGSLIFLNVENFDLLYRINYESTGCIRIAWHSKINQILVGLSDGTCRLYYDLMSSIRGALECVAKPVRRSRQDEVVKEEIILAPLTLAMFQPKGEDDEEKEVTEWRLKRYLRNLGNRKRPEFRQPASMPLSGPSAGGRLQAHGGTLHSYIAQELGVQKNKSLQQRDEDVRAAILKHQDEAEKNPMYVTKAYLKTQPKPIFQEKTTAPEDERDDDDLMPMYKVQKLG